MFYFRVITKEKVEKFLKKLTPEIKKQIDKAIKSLRIDPMRKGKILGSLYSGLVFFEKRIYAGGGYRIYYTVDERNIIICDIEYLGIVDVELVGSKKTQKKDLKYLKKIAKKIKTRRNLRETKVKKKPVTSKTTKKRKTQTKKKKNNNNKKKH